MLSTALIINPPLFTTFFYIIYIIPHQDILSNKKRPYLSTDQGLITTQIIKMRILFIHRHLFYQLKFVFLRKKKRPYSNPGLVMGFTGLKPAAQEGE
jgi:hypothetical protein